jgi:hypothetical protein
VEVVQKLKFPNNSIIDKMLDNIDFRGLTQDEAVGREGIIKRLTGRLLQRALALVLHEGYNYL